MVNYFFFELAFLTSIQMFLYEYVFSYSAYQYTPLHKNPRQIIVLLCDAPHELAFLIIRH